VRHNAGFLFVSMVIGSLLASCASSYAPDHGDYPDDFRTSVVVYEPVFLSDALTPDNFALAFDENLLVGAVQFQPEPERRPGPDRFASSDDRTFAAVEEWRAFAKSRAVALLQLSMGPAWKASSLKPVKPSASAFSFESARLSVPDGPGGPVNLNAPVRERRLLDVHATPETGLTGADPEPKWALYTFVEACFQYSSGRFNGQPRPSAAGLHERYIFALVQQKNGHCVWQAAFEQNYQNASVETLDKNEVTREAEKMLTAFKVQVRQTLR